MAMAKLALLILVAAFLAGTSNGDCDYQVEVKTTGLPLSATDAQIYLQLYNQDGSGVFHVAKFDYGSDTVTFTDSKCLEPCRLIFHLLGNGLPNLLFCEYVHITVIGDNPYSQHFPVYQPVLLGQPIERDQCAN